jgi:hypothetical protein
MTNDHSPPTLQCAALMLKHYAEIREITPQQILDIFHEGISAIADNYPEDHSLRIAVMRGCASVDASNVEVTGAARLYRAASVWTAGLCFTLLFAPDICSLRIVNVHFA